MGAAYVSRTPTGWTGHHLCLGTNKGILGAELCAIYRALCTLGERQEDGRRYTIFSDSTAAIDRIRTDTLGPGQRFAVAASEVCSCISQGQRGHGQMGPSSLHGRGK